MFPSSADQTRKTRSDRAARSIEGSIHMQHDTICRLCSAVCPVTAETHNGIFVRAERKSSLPPEKRLTCPRLNAAPEIVYAPDRVLTPQIRTNAGKSGAAAFREASWNEALDLVVEKFHFFKKNHGAESVAWLRGMAADWGAPWDYANRLMNLFGSPNTIGNGSVCHVAREMAHAYTYGAMTMPQTKTSRCIVIWGKNDRNTAPAAAEAILHARERGARLIVIDPVRTYFAGKADIWLQIKPGHDGYLAMAMLNEIINNRLYDKDFVRQYVIGFDDLAAAARAYPAERAGPFVGLNPELIRKAAKMYAQTKPACIIDGNGLDMQVPVFQATRAVCMLRAVTGNLDRDGGDFFPQPVPVSDMQLKGRLPAEIEPISRDYSHFNAFHPTWGVQAQSCLVDAVLEEKPYPVRMLVVQSGNPVITMPDAARVKQAFEKLAFVVVIDLFRNRTAEHADVILPAAGCFEKTQLNRAYLRNGPVILQNQVIDCLGASRPDWWITFELARRLGFTEEFPWTTVEEAIDYQLAPSGLTAAMLRKHPDGLRVSSVAFEKYRLRGFDTPSGKVECFSRRMQAAGYPPVPFQNGALENPISFAETIGSDPEKNPLDKHVFIGISGERTNRYTHTQFRNIPSLRKRENEGFADIHPADARRLDIRDGQVIAIATPRGRVRMKARISDVIAPGVVRIAWGWGEVDDDAGINNLTDDSRRDPVTCTPSVRTFMCRIEISQLPIQN
jgi:anaerobic selenocysteine-containing dehydrogenase